MGIIRIMTLMVVIMCAVAGVMEKIRGNDISALLIIILGTLFLIFDRLETIVELNAKKKKRVR